MKISKLALAALLGSALVAFGCGESSPGGNGGSGGEGGGAPTCDSTACILCPASALGPSGEVFGDLNVPLNFTAVPQGDVVQGDTVTIDIAGSSEINGLPVPIVATVNEASTTTYMATTGGSGTLDIPIPEQTLMGTDLMINAGSGSGPFVVDADATELVIELNSAVIDISVTSPAPISLKLDASADGDCTVVGDGVTIPVSGAGGAGGSL